MLKVLKNEWRQRERLPIILEKVKLNSKEGEATIDVISMMRVTLNVGKMCVFVLWIAKRHSTDWNCLNYSKH